MTRPRQRPRGSSQREQRPRYRLFTGDLPFRSRDWTDAWFSHLNEPVPPMPPECGVPPALETVVRKALEKRPEDRYLDAHEMRLALRDAVNSSAADPSLGLSGLFPTPEAPITPAAPPPEPTPVERLILLAAGTLTATALLLAGWTVARVLFALWRGAVAA